MPRKKDLEMLDVEPMAVPGSTNSPYSIDDAAAKDAAVREAAEDNVDEGSLESTTDTPRPTPEHEDVSKED